MTTIDALARAVDVRPGDDTAQLAYADCLDEDDRPQQACDQRLAVVMRRIIATPADDEPRLRYAEVCEQYGRAARAEFIRLQIRWLVQLGVERYQESGWTLCRREQELWHRSDTTWMVGFPLHVMVEWPVFWRGFAAEWTCPWAMWQANADAIRAAHPIERVMLTTCPSWNEHQYSDPFLTAVWPGIEFILMDAQWATR